MSGFRRQTSRQLHELFDRYFEEYLFRINDWLLEMPEPRFGNAGMLIAGLQDAINYETIGG